MRSNENIKRSPIVFNTNSALCLDHYIESLSRGIKAGSPTRNTNRSAQLYIGSQFYWWMKPEDTGKKT